MIERMAYLEIWNQELCFGYGKFEVSIVYSVEDIKELVISGTSRVKHKFIKHQITGGF